MDRRHAITALSGVVAASALLALPRRPAWAQKPTGSIGAGEYKTQTLAVGSFSKQLSQLAMARAAHPRVKEFAGFEVGEQTAIAQVLTNTADPPPVPPGPAMTGELAQLQQQQGKAFDLDYVRLQIQGHGDLYAIQQDFLNGTPTDMDREHIAVLARAVIQMHLTMLQDLQAMLTNA